MATTLTCPSCGPAAVLINRWDERSGDIKLCCDGCDYSEDLPVDAQLAAQGAQRLPWLS